MLLLQILSVPGGTLLALLIAGAALRTPRARHGKRRGIRTGLPTEIRRHRRGRLRTWEHTTSLRQVAPPTPHALDETSETSRRNAAANRYEDTGEITQADLDALLGPRPAELIGASA